MNLADELHKLDQLHQTGALSDEEFARAKDALLNPPTVVAAPDGPRENAADREQQTRQWAMFLHLSLLAGYVVPFAGLVLPIVLWQVKKTELPGIDVHGKIVVNWIISWVILFHCVRAVGLRHRRDTIAHRPGNFGHHLPDPRRGQSKQRRGLEIPVVHFVLELIAMAAINLVNSIPRRYQSGR